MNDVSHQTTTVDDDGWEWAYVEIFGNRSHWGRAREERRFGARMLRIDVPTSPAPPTLFDASDDKSEQPAIVWQTRYYAGSSIFSYAPVDEASVMRANNPNEAPSCISRPSVPEDYGDELGGIIGGQRVTECSSNSRQT